MEQEEIVEQKIVDSSIITPPSEDEENESVTFEELNLNSDIINQLAQIGWEKPTPVQRLCLPYTLEGRDVAGFAQTGTGKTGVFVLTLAQRILQLKSQGDGDPTGPYALILTPTRELAMQVCGDAEKILDKLGIKSLAVFGGVDYEKQANKLKKGVDIVVATPGRVKDYHKKKIFNLDSCKLFVCDEADRMFDMGFIEDVEYFLEKMDDSTQKLLFSATTNEQVKELAFEYLENPEYISVTPETITPEKIEQNAIIVESVNKLKVMLGLLREHQPDCAIIFTNTKLVADWLHYKLLNNQIDVDVITGDLPQKKRISLINKIKSNKIKGLIATDVASRGLHIAGVTHVYNFDLPDDASNYVHRIGRTARAGAKGFAFSLVCEDYGHNLRDIQELLGENLKIESVWHDASYLDIEDKAPNPYQDENFKGSLLKSDKGDSRGSRSEGKERGDRKTRESRKGASDGRRQKGGGSKRDKDPRKSRKGSTTRTDRKPQKGKSQHGKGAPSKAKAREKKAPQAQPASVGGLLKRVVSIIFGKKKK